MNKITYSTILLLLIIGVNAQNRVNKNKEEVKASLLDKSEAYSGFFDFNYSPEKTLST